MRERHILLGIEFGLFAHHFKLAFRNLRKYKTQNIISIIGLAVGFVCFAFSALWIRYEMSYDNFHANADRIYRVHVALHKWNAEETGTENVVELRTPYALINWLKSNYPEIEDASGIIALGTRFIGTIRGYCGNVETFICEVIVVNQVYVILV